MRLQATGEGPATNNGGWTPLRRDVTSALEALMIDECWYDAVMVQVSYC
jgi:hypothetical protein